MKQLYYSLIAMIFSLPALAQDLSGTWQWTSPDGLEQFSLELQRINDREYRGWHCASFENGNLKDCKTNQDTFSVIIVEVTDDVYAGTIESAVELSQGKIRMQYMLQDNLLNFNLTKNPVGIFYLPESVTLSR